MGVAHRSVRSYHEHTAELGSVSLDPALVDRNAPKTKPRRDRVLDPLGDDPQPEELVERRDLGASQLVGPPLRIGEHLKLYALNPAELGRFLGCADADQRETDARLVELLPGAVQLHRVLATENSAVVAQENQDRWPVSPQVAKPHVVTRVVLEDNILKVTRVDRRLCALADPYGP